jgi:tRNA dimethylallyltransferase
MKKVLVILGPTATGKTDLALRIASSVQGELVSCDSRQVYKGLDIGSGKDLSLFGEIPVWMLDVADPKTQYTVFGYIKQAETVIEDILKRGKLPVIVGGTGFYLKALLEGLPNLQIPVNEKLREELRGLSKNELQEKLQSLSPAGWQKLNRSDKQNPRRLIRSLELESMNPYVKTSQKSKIKGQNWDVLKIGLTAPQEILKKMIFDRLIKRIDQGLIEEGEKLHKSGLSFKRMKELGLEYGMLAMLLGGEINKEQFINRLSVKINQYAKRQMTWFKREKQVNWFDIRDQNLVQKVANKVESWYHTPNDQKN